MRIKQIAIIVTLAAACIIGPVLLFMGIKGQWELKQRTEHFQEAEGTLVDYTPHTVVRRRRRETTYYLHYEYQADGYTYQVKTDYTVGMVPRMGSKEVVLYNPDLPADAVIRGTNGNIIMIVVGGMFAIVPITGILLLLYRKGILGGGSIEWADVVIGAVTAFMGFGFLYVGGGSFSPAKILEKMSFLALIPLMLGLAGIFLIVRGFRGGMKAMEERAEKRKGR